MILYCLFVIFIHVHVASYLGTLDVEHMDIKDVDCNYSPRRCGVLNAKKIDSSSRSLSNGSSLTNTNLVLDSRQAPASMSHGLQ
jgi:hypothetical protein